MEAENKKPNLINLNEDHKEFRCNICNKFLSVAPVLFHNSFGNVCGRCYENGELKKFGESIIFQAQGVYENIAKYITFPCSYQINGCSELLKWGEVQQHEETCNFKQNCCPFSVNGFRGHDDEDEPDCEWNGTNKELVSHMLENHKEYYSSSLEMYVYPSAFSSEILLSKVMENYLIVVLYYCPTNARHFCNVLMDDSFVNCKKYEYDLEILDNKEKSSIVIPGNEIEPIGEKAFTGKSINKNLDLDFISINKLLKKSSSMILRFKLKILLNEETEPRSSELVKNEENCEINPKVLFPELVCHCGKFLFQPIRVCGNGHNSCNNCISASTYCKNCNSAFIAGSNTTLETLAKLTKYPCKNQTQGCKFATEYKLLKAHEENCCFTDIACILNCGWIGTNAEMLRHVQEKHSSLRLNKSYTHDGKTKQYTVCFHKRVFLFTLDFKVGSPVSTKLQCLGMENMDYEYELTIFSSCNNIKLVTCHLCQPLLYGEDKKEIATTNIVYPFEFFRQFVTDYKQFDFKININKIQNS